MRVRWTDVRPLFTTCCLCAALALVLAACGSRRPAVAPVHPTPPLPQIGIMGPARLSGAQILDWLDARRPRPLGTYAATVPLETLVRIYLEEGAAEGVTGDVAFMQSVIETGWFRFMGSVPATLNNFAGIGSTDRNPAPAAFADAVDSLERNAS
jgi:hypothetical protein